MFPHTCKLALRLGWGSHPTPETPPCSCVLHPGEDCGYAVVSVACRHCCQVQVIVSCPPSPTASFPFLSPLSWCLGPTSPIFDLLGSRSSPPTGLASCTVWDLRDRGPCMCLCVGAGLTVGRGPGSEGRKNWAS